jgi:DNA-binding MarR family transcriptional regulator
VPDDDALTPSAAASLSAREEGFLQALSRAVVFIPRVLEADLGRVHGLSTSEFFALMHLSEAPSGSLRMGDLAAQSALSLGAVTRVVKLLEGKGLVQRRRSAADGRGQDAILTEAGLARLALVRPAMVDSARRRVFDKLAELDGADLDACTAVLSCITQND